MRKEHRDYKRNLDLLNARYPDHEMLSEQQAMEVTGYKTRITIRKHLGKSFVNHRISKAALARWMCGN